MAQRRIGCQHDPQMASFVNTSRAPPAAVPARDVFVKTASMERTRMAQGTPRKLVTDMSGVPLSLRSLTRRGQQRVDSSANGPPWAVSPTREPHSVLGN